jgi:hypothetical protein
VDKIANRNIREKISETLSTIESWLNYIFLEML